MAEKQKKKDGQTYKDGKGKKVKRTPPMPRLGETKYKPIYRDKMWEYFMNYDEEGIPQMSQFARQIRVDVKTLRNWRNTYEDFALMYEICMEYQKELLNNGGITGKFNPRMVQFLLSANHKVQEYARKKADDKGAQDVEMSADDRNLMLAIEQRLLRGGHEELTPPDDMLNEGAVPQGEDVDET